MSTKDDNSGPKTGRPSSYQVQYAEQAKRLCDLGATDKELADFFNVTDRTINRWKLDHPEFCQSLKSGKEPADDRTERSLYQRANGFHFIEQQAFKVKTSEGEKIEIVEVERYCPPDTVSMIFWLKNRRPSEWRDKVVSETTFPNGIPVVPITPAMSPQEAERAYSDFINGRASPSADNPPTDKTPGGS